LTVPTGLWLWHRQGRHFGFAGAGGQVSRGAVAVCMIALAVIALLEILFGSD